MINENTLCVIEYSSVSNVFKKKFACNNKGNKCSTQVYKYILIIHKLTSYKHILLRSKSSHSKWRRSDNQMVYVQCGRKSVRTVGIYFFVWVYNLKYLKKYILQNLYFNSFCSEVLCVNRKEAKKLDVVVHSYRNFDILDYQSTFITPKPIVISYNRI